MKIILNEAQFKELLKHALLKEATSGVLNEYDPYNISDIKQFVADLSNMRNKLNHYALNFKGIDQETRQKLKSAADDISSIRKSMFSDAIYPVPDGKLSPFDDDERIFTSSRFDDDD